MSYMGYSDHACTADDTAGYDLLMTKDATRAVLGYDTDNDQAAYHGLCQTRL